MFVFLGRATSLNLAQTFRQLKSCAKIGQGKTARCLRTGSTPRCSLYNWLSQSLHIDVTTSLRGRRRRGGKGEKTSARSQNSQNSRAPFEPFPPLQRPASQATSQPLPVALIFCAALARVFVSPKCGNTSHPRYQGGVATSSFGIFVIF